MHYQRVKKYGDPNGGRWTKYTDAAELIRNCTVVDSNGCKVWQRTLEDGYGLTTIGYKPKRIHRLAWDLAGKTVPIGMMLDHTCHNRACCNVQHLRLVTNKQNVENASAMRSDNVSGYRGVYWNQRLNKWIAQVRHNGKAFHLGAFTEIEDAARAAQSMRNGLFTHNDLDRAKTLILEERAAS